MKCYIELQEAKHKSTHIYISTLAILIQTSKSNVLFTILVTNETTYMIK